MSLLNKLFNKKDKEIKTQSKFTGTIEGSIVYKNAYIDLIHDSCSICYNKPTDKDMEDKAVYIEKRIYTGHESILEHSNIIMLLQTTNKMMEDILEFIDTVQFIHTKIKTQGDNIYILLGGSIRGYKDVVREIENPNNKVYKEMLETMYGIHSCSLKDFVNDNIMDQHKFLDDLTDIPRIDNIKNLKNEDIVNIDPIDTVLESISQYGFTREDLLPMCTCSIKINRVARVISQQLTRHRVGITQLSQRYVDYAKSEFGFISPAENKPDKYDVNKKYTITLNNFEFSLTLQELGDMLMTIYPQLINQGLLKEDARAYLPNNAETSLYMTFTFKKLIKFLELRCHMSAQADIRSLALEIEPIIKEILGDKMYDYLIPKYERHFKELEEEIVDQIDEVIEL